MTHETEQLHARIAALESENQQLRQQNELLKAQTESSGAPAPPSSTPNPPTNQATKDKFYEILAAALRQSKYELFCGTYDLLGYSLHINADRSCDIASVYTKDDPAMLMQFEYNPLTRSYEDMQWKSEFSQFAGIYKYWVKEMQCVPGFLAALFLHYFDTYGPPPPRKRPSN